jgi:tRNA modification GTPase
LLNRIAKRDAAIVSPFAGTTRDVIEVHLDLGGLPMTLLDTAGIRETDDPVEREGVMRARRRANEADLLLWVVDANVPTDDWHFPDVRRDRLARENWLVRNKIDLDQRDNKRNEQLNQNKQTNELLSHTNGSLKKVVNKRLKKRTEFEFNPNESSFDVSAITGQGFEPLLAELGRYATDFLSGAESALVTRERHRQALESALAALRRARAPDVATREDLLAEELRMAGHALGRLTGRVDVEDVLDVIFRDFCIGK